MNPRRRVTVMLLTLITGCVLVLVSQTLARRTGAFEQIDLLADIRHLIVSGFVEEPDQEQMIESAVRGMVESLNDPYTIFLDLDELEPFDRQVHGSFSGIGAEVTIDPDLKRLKIVSPLEDSPAWDAGIMAGDIILEIEGVSTFEMSLPKAVKQLTGKEGTPVEIVIQHESGEVRKLTIIRQRINIQTVRGLRRGADNHWVFMLNPDQGIGYIRITQFTTKTAGELRAALDQLRDRQMRGLILDVRFNPGGLLESAVEVSDMFLDGGKQIVSVKGRVVPEHVQKSDSPDTIPNIPIVVLANEASASAAEIVTGALSDNGRAKFIGARTYGKGSVQQVRKLDNDLGALKITYAYYYLPSGRNIHRREDAEVWGVDPDDGFYVPMTFEQARQMIQIRRDGDVLRPDNGDAQALEVTPEWLENELADPQLAAAVRALIGKLESGLWPTVGQAGIDQIIKQTQRRNLTHQRQRLMDRLDLINDKLAELDRAQEGEAGAEELSAEPPEPDDAAVQVEPDDLVPEAVDVKEQEQDEEQEPEPAATQP